MKILSAAKEQKYDSSYETYMKMLEVIHTKDLFLNVKSNKKFIKEDGHVEQKNFDKAITSWTLES